MSGFCAVSAAFDRAEERRPRADLAEVASASASDPDRRGRGSPPARRRRSRRGCPGAAGCLRSWSGALRGSRPAGRWRRRRAAIDGRVEQRLAGDQLFGLTSRTGRSSPAGCFVQAVTPASASDAPISLRNVRRATGSVIASICDGNSLYRRSWNAGSPARSSRRPPEWVGAGAGAAHSALPSPSP